MNNEKRTLHPGDVFLNRYAGWQTILVYIRSSRHKDPLAHCVYIVKVDGKTMVKEGFYYKHDLQYDKEAFPYLGHIDLKEMWKNTILSALTDKSFFDEYDETGHVKRRKE